MNNIDLSRAKVFIIGDIMLDRYYYGSVSRISPEAPVPVVAVNSDVFTLGGAGNVANNISCLKASCSIVGVAAEDTSGIKLRKLLDNINAEYFFIDTGVPTTTKLRIIGEKQQIVRVDFEEIKQLDTDCENIFKSRAEIEINKSSSVVISDYGKGVCTPNICKFVISKTREEGKSIIVDPKGSDWSKYTGASIITPNVKELSAAAGIHLNNTDNEIIPVASEIRKKFSIDYLVVTRSEKGITIISEKECIHIPTQAIEVFDVSGAGDTVVATIAAALGAGISIRKSVEIANEAAGIVCGKIGTAPINIDELNFKIDNKEYSKIIPYDKILMITENERKKGRKIVFTNGCFDILHKGHTSYLSKAKSLGDILILGLNSDSSVKRIKGSDRPINNENDRAEVLSALESVDYIVIFDDDTPLNLIKMVKPDILVKGGDYTPENVVGREYAEKVAIIDYVTGYSTTNIIKKLNGGL